jgi:hypothetical protein
MTRSEFIHRAVLEGMRTNAEDGQPIGKETVLLWAYSLADAIEKDDKAPWSDPNDTAILKRIDHEAFQRGYAMGVGDGRKYAVEEARSEAHCVCGVPSSEHAARGCDNFTPDDRPVVTVEGRDGRVVEKGP